MKLSEVINSLKNMFGGQEWPNPRGSKPTAIPTPTPDPSFRMTPWSDAPVDQYDNPDIGNILGATSPLEVGTTWAKKDKPIFPTDLTPLVNKYGSQYEVSPLAMAGQLAQESGGFNYKSIPGTSGEQGIAQIIPKYYWKGSGADSLEEYAQRLANDNEFAIKEQARIMSKLFKKHGNYFDAYREYNAGPRLINGTNYAKDILERLGKKEGEF